MITKKHFEYLAALLSTMEDGGTVKVGELEEELKRFARHYGSNFDEGRFDARVKQLRESGEHWRYVK